MRYRSTGNSSRSTPNRVSAPGLDGFAKSIKETAEITAASKRKLSTTIHETRRLKIAKKFHLRQQTEELDGEIRRREMALREREMTLREFQAGMTSTASQHQEYNFHQTPRSLSQFPEPNDEELPPRENTGYDTDAEGDANTSYYV